MLLTTKVIIIIIQTFSNTAIPDDLTFSSLTPMFDATNPTKVCVNITGQTDNLAEGDQQISVSIMDNPTLYTINSLENRTEIVTITVIDNDSKSFWGT